jgi:hypothetical protein
MHTFLNISLYLFVVVINWKCQEGNSSDVLRHVPNNTAMKIYMIDLQGDI